MNISTAVTAGAVILIVLGALCGALSGIGRSAVRLVLLVLCFFAALAAASPLAGLVPSDAVTAAAGDRGAELCREIPTLGSLAAALPRALAAPLMFAAVFVLLALVTVFLVPVLSRLIFGAGRARGILSRIFGGLCGAVCALAAVWVLLMPAAGYTAAAGEIVAASDKEALTSSLDADEYLGGLRGLFSACETLDGALGDNAALGTVGKCGGERMFDSLGRMKNVIEGEDILLSDCAPSLARAVSVFAPFAGVSPADCGQAQIDAAYQAADIVEEDALVRNIAAEMLRGVSSAWLDGKEFCGMEKPQVNILVRPAFDALLAKLAATDAESLATEARTAAGLVELAIKYKNRTSLY